MDRRTLIAGLSAAAAWLSLSGCARLVLTGRRHGNGHMAALTTPLSEQLAELADPLFRDYSTGRSVNALHSVMVQKGVLSPDRGVNHQKVINLTRHEPIVIYKGFYYTQTELELYALAYLHQDQNRSSIPQ